MSQSDESYQLNFPPSSDNGVPDLQEWIKFYDGYHNIPPAGWAHWDRLREA